LIPLAKQSFKFAWLKSVWAKHASLKSIRSIWAFVNLHFDKFCFLFFAIDWMCLQLSNSQKRTQFLKKKRKEEMAQFAYCKFTPLKYAEWKLHWMNFAVDILDRINETWAKVMCTNSDCSKSVSIQLEFVKLQSSNWQFWKIVWEKLAFAKLHFEMRQFVNNALFKLHLKNW
jgi:hypothetical protein